MNAPTLNNAAFADFDTLLDASLDDIKDLPAMGVPPTGFYTLQLTMDKILIGDDNQPAVNFKYTVLDIGNVRNSEEAGEVSVGQTFTQNVIPKTRAGEVNDMGISAMKRDILPFATFLGNPSMTVNEAINRVKDIKFTAVLKRRPNRKNPDYFNFSMEEVTPI